jgi:hypothetical protein
MTTEFLTSETDPLSIRITGLAMGQAVRWSDAGKPDVEIMSAMVDAMAVSLASILIACLAESPTAKESIEEVAVAAAARTTKLAHRQLDKFAKHLRKAKQQNAHPRPN